mmetsp:Transcript_5116/g.11748  ORF Transcript_5116/g.11748 Transcript_5116/m.11748 type:complete len:200 (+) Transcript_5116:306-905(+)
MSPPKKPERASKIASFFFSITRPVRGPMIGGDGHQSISSPSPTFHDEPWSGHTIVSPMTSAPSLIGVPRWGHRLPTQKSLPPSVLPTSTSTPPKLTALSSVGARSLSLKPVLIHARAGRMVCVVYLAAVFEGLRRPAVPGATNVRLLRSASSASAATTHDRAARMAEAAPTTGRQTRRPRRLGQQLGNTLPLSRGGKAA